MKTKSKLTEKIKALLKDIDRDLEEHFRNKDAWKLDYRFYHDQFLSDAMGKKYNELAFVLYAHIEEKYCVTANKGETIMITGRKNKK